MRQQRTNSLDRFERCRPEGQPQLSQLPARDWCFVVSQRCEVPQGEQVLDFHAACFAEALCAAEALPHGWRHDEISLVFKHGSEAVSRSPSDLNPSDAP